MLRALTLVVLTVFIATVAAQYRASDIFSAEGCNGPDLIGSVSERNDSCTPVLCEQIGTQYRSVSCITRPAAMLSSFIVFTTYSDNACTGSTTPRIVGVRPNTCVNVTPDPTATLFAFCTSQNVVYWENNKLDDCATVVTNTSEARGGCAGSAALGYTKITCPAGPPTDTPVAGPIANTVPQGATPTRTPAKTSDAVALVGLVCVATSVVMVLF